MKKSYAIVIIVLLLLDMVLMGWAGIYFVNVDKNLAELELVAQDIEERIVSETTHVMVTEPGNMFMFLDDHPEWEEIDAVPYSRCYRHLIGTGTSTADYIMCMAI